eukprot:6033868-Pyramimonas_sp.AAC.2
MTCTPGPSFGAQCPLVLCIRGARSHQRIVISPPSGPCSHVIGPLVTSCPGGLTVPPSPAGPIQWLYRRIMRSILLSPEQGARASVYAATEASLANQSAPPSYSPEGAPHTGGFLFVYLFGWPVGLQLVSQRVRMCGDQ